MLHILYCPFRCTEQYNRPAFAVLYISAPVQSSRCRREVRITNIITVYCNSLRLGLSSNLLSYCTSLSLLSSKFSVPSLVHALSPTRLRLFIQVQYDYRSTTLLYTCLFQRLQIYTVCIMKDKKSLIPQFYFSTFYF